MSALTEPWTDLSLIYSLAEQAALEWAKENSLPGRMHEDLVQEAVTWLLESPGKAWTRDALGEFENATDAMVADIKEHYRRKGPEGI